MSSTRSANRLKKIFSKDLSNAPKMQYQQTLSMPPEFKGETVIFYFTQNIVKNLFWNWNISKQNLELTDSGNWRTRMKKNGTFTIKIFIFSQTNVFVGGIQWSRGILSARWVKYVWYMGRGIFDPGRKLIPAKTWMSNTPLEFITIITICKKCAPFNHYKSQLT